MSDDNEEEGEEAKIQTRNKQHSQYVIVTNDYANENNAAATAVHYSAPYCLGGARALEFQYEAGIEFASLAPKIVNFAF